MNDTCRTITDNEGEPVRVHGAAALSPEAEAAVRQLVEVAKQEMDA
ncbi:MAG: hypothetical protein JWO67_4017 [Streptosporangiaceae bacterium]|nr:hypothetical protein [Streptosporangiaceae bacterium]